MSTPHLKIGCYEYDRTRALFDGTVKFEGLDATLEGAKLVSDLFEKMIRHQTFDVSELGFSFYLRTLDLDNPPFIAVPVFPNRIFRKT